MQVKRQIKNGRLQKRAYLLNRSDRNGNPTHLEIGESSVTPSCLGNT